MIDFRHRAACRDQDPELFFPVAEPGTAPYERQVAAAKAVCAGCPVRAECLEHAAVTEDVFAILGGTTPTERREARRKAAARAA